jgi:hypothetical protein
MQQKLNEQSELQFYEGKPSTGQAGTPPLCLGDC